MTAVSITDFSRLAFSHKQPHNQAVLKQDFEDFQVQEVIGFEFSGAGDHQCLQIQKTGLTTTDVAKTISSTYAVRLSEVGYAGMKDKRGICTQWFSVPRMGKSGFDPGKIENKNLKVIDVRDNDRKIRIGSHKANAFKIRLQKLQGSEADLLDRVERISSQGVPNYFGPQRFGKNSDNVIQALEYFSALDECKPQPDKASLPGSQKASQKTRLKARLKKSMMLSASRSYLFNLILSRRVEDKSWNQALPGEVFNLDSTSRLFLPDWGGEGAGDATWLAQHEELKLRLSGLDIHPTGLLFGKMDRKDKYIATREVEALEREIVGHYPQLCQGLLKLGVIASRRALRLVPRDMILRMLNAETADIEFTLPAGGYATVVLRELCQTSEPQGLFVQQGNRE